MRRYLEYMTAAERASAASAGQSGLLARGSAADDAPGSAAIRVAIAVRGDSPQGRIGPDSLTLFADLPALAKTVTLTEAERQFQFQVYETVVPIRNATSALCAEHRRLLGLPAPSTCE